jgi:hypothetical protein
LAANILQPSKDKGKKKSKKKGFLIRGKNQKNQPLSKSHGAAGTPTLAVASLRRVPPPPPPQPQLPILPPPPIANSRPVSAPKIGCTERNRATQERDRRGRGEGWVGVGVRGGGERERDARAHPHQHPHRWDRKKAGKCLSIIRKAYQTKIKWVRKGKNPQEVEDDHADKPNEGKIKKWGGKKRRRFSGLADAEDYHADKLNEGKIKKMGGKIKKMEGNIENTIFWPLRGGGLPCGQAHQQEGK